MMKKHILEKLADTNPDCEIWWDSSPLVYKSWAMSMVDNSPLDKKEIWKEQLHRLFDPEQAGDMIFRGVTTNPPLSFIAIKDNPSHWAENIKNTILQNPGKNAEEIFWLTYKTIVQKGAEMVLPLWEKSDHRYGYISGQVDPRFVFNSDAMFEQAIELSELSPNVMIKIPGTKEGYEVIEKLTERGIGTNNTLAFSIPQFLSCMNAIKKGLNKAKQNNVDLSRWRSVITHMSDRFGALGDLKIQAESRGIELTIEDIRWAELAIFKRAYELAIKEDYPGKMLICSMRLGPQMDDNCATCWHIEKIAGANVVYTCPPKFIKQLMDVEDKIDSFNSEAFLERSPQESMDKLMRLPYFIQSYEQDGMKEEEYNRYASLIATAAEFSSATRGMIDFVVQQFQALGKDWL